MKILVADDDAVYRRELELLLAEWHYEVVTAADGLQAVRALEGEDAPRLAILDWMMPGKDGLEVCRQLRSAPTEPYTYVLLLTVRGEKRDVVAGLEAGADDYLAKPFDAAELRARLRAGRRILALQEALRSARDTLRFRSAYDPLTGLWNRVGVLETLGRELARSERQGTCLSVVMADLDGFRRVNARFGTMAGDVALREAARRLQSGARAWDTVGRYGGEEFLLVLPETDADRARACTERLRAAFREGPMDLPGGTVHLTFSAGGSSLGKGRHAEVRELVGAAAEALERAKSQGGDTLAWAPPAGSAPRVGRLGHSARRRSRSERAA